MKVIVKTLWPELSKYKVKLIFVLILGVIISGLKSYMPKFIQSLQIAWEQHDTESAQWIPLTFVAAWLLISLCRYWHLYWMKFISDLVSVKLRRDLMNKYLTLNLAFRQNFTSGSGGLISRMVNDIGIIQVGIHKIADLLREPFTAIAMFAWLVYLNWGLTLFIIAALPFIVLISKRLGTSLKKYSHQNQEAMEDLTSTLKESLDGSRVVQSFNLESEMRRQFDREADVFLETRRKIISREEATAPITESVVSLFIAALLYYISHLIFNDQFSNADFVAFLFALTFFQDAFKKIQYGYVKLQQSSVAMERLQEILTNQSVVPQIEAPKEFPESWKEIKYDNVSLSLNGNSILNKINLNIKRGEVIAFVGPSGSGKTSLVNLLERFFDPSSGVISLDGINITDIELNDLRSHIALVNQDVFLFGDTIEQNIRAGDLQKKGDVIESAKIANAHNFIMQMEEQYKSKVGDYGGRLSGGEKQRISIARAIYKDAPILILDEATSALDSKSEKEVQQSLDKLMQGRTALVIAHRLSTIKNADRIFVLKDGEVIEEGNHDTLLALEGEYSRLYKLQQ